MQKAIRSLTGASLGEYSLENFFENDYVSMAILDRNFNFVRVNRKFATDNGRDVSFFPGKNHFALYPSEETELIFEQVVREQKEYRNYGKDLDGQQQGNMYRDWLLLPIEQSDGEVGLLALFLDDETKRIRANQELIESREKLYRMLRKISDGFFILTPDWRFAFINQEAQGMLLNKSEQELIGKVFWEVYPKTAGTEMQYWFEQAMEGQIPVCFEYQGRYRDRVYGIHAYPSREGISVLMRDLTVTRRMEGELKQLQELFNKAFQCSPSLMLIYSLDTNLVIDVNDSFLEHTGLSRKEVVGQAYDGLPGFDEAQLAGFSYQLEQGLEVENREIVYANRQEEGRNGLLSMDLIEVGGQKHVLTVINDITEYSKLNAKLSRLERLNVIGQMAAGIGHEIRNPLTTVRGFLQFLGDKCDQNKYADIIELMISELDRANGIITDLLSLGKNRAIESKEIDLNEVLESIFPLIKANGSREDKTILLELGEIPICCLDENEIRQLLINLINNGLEAMEPGGTLKLLTYADVDGESAVIAVQDEGRGIPIEMRDKLGTPFCTTKENGTGLGLATCFQIVKRHGGTLDYQTGSWGTTFFVSFPAAGLQVNELCE